MNEETTQLDSGGQEAGQHPVAQKLGLMDERDLSDLLKSSFLNEEEAAPQEHQESPEAVDPSSEDDLPADDDPETGDNSSLTRGVQKRINKLVAAKKAAQAELDAHKQRLGEMERELAAAKQSAKPPQQDIDEAVNSLETFDQLKEEYNNAVNVILWCERNRDGATLNGVDLSDSDVLDLKAAAIRRKEIELPNRLSYLQQQAQYDQSIQQDFPWWGKPDTEEYQAAQHILREFPEFKKRRADYKHVAGLVVLGLKAYMDMKSKKPAAPLKKAPPQPGVRQAPPSASAPSLQQAKQKFAKAGGARNELGDLVKTMGFV